MRPRSIPNERVPGAELSSFERFEKFVGLIARVPKAEADKEAESQKGNNGIVAEKVGASKPEH